MDKNIIGAIVAVPLLIATSNFAGGGCNYTQPDLVFAKACADDQCRAQVQKHLPRCKSRFTSELNTSVRHEDGVARAPRLTFAVMGKLTDCIANESHGAFNQSSVDFSAFREVSKDVRGDKAKPAGGGMYLYPVVGQTTFLYGPA